MAKRRVVQGAKTGTPIDVDVEVKRFPADLERVGGYYRRRYEDGSALYILPNRLDLIEHLAPDNWRGQPRENFDPAFSSRAEDWLGKGAYFTKTKPIDGKSLELAVKKCDMHEDGLYKKFFGDRMEDLIDRKDDEVMRVMEFRTASKPVLRTETPYGYCQDPDGAYYSLYKREKGISLAQAVLDERITGKEARALKRDLKNAMKEKGYHISDFKFSSILVEPDGEGVRRNPDGSIPSRIVDFELLKRGPSLMQKMGDRWRAKRSK